MYKNDDKVVCINAKDCPELVEGNVYNVNWFDGKYWLSLRMPELDNDWHCKGYKSYNHERFQLYKGCITHEEGLKHFYDLMDDNTRLLCTDDEFAEGVAKDKEIKEYMENEFIETSELDACEENVYMTAVDKLLNKFQQSLMKYDPATGEEKPYPSHAEQYRAYHGQRAWLINPWSGNERDAYDIGSDVFGLLIEDKGE